jgi:AcrR family transcriptional regulator
MKKRTRPPKKRKYTLKRRAERQEATRNRIVEATVALHEELGPRDTTISAIAERAGVQRLTVYRHFQDDSSLFAACSSRYLEENPVPDPARWRAHEDPLARTRTALEAVYAYYRGTRRMWTRVYRDLDDVPAVREVMAGFDAYLDAVRQDLLQAWESASGAAEPETGTILGHALRFSTWKSLAEDGLGDGAMAGLVSRWLRAGSVASTPF